MSDHLGSIRDVAVLNESTRTTSIANHLVYDEYGKVISETNAAVDHIFGYTGREIDDETDLQFNRARYYYDAATGRWISEDPIGFAAGDANLNRYVGNGPTLAKDPTGKIGAVHHIVPQELWALFGFDEDIATEVFDHKDARIETKAMKLKGNEHNRLGHGRTGYTGHVANEMNSELCKFMTDAEKKSGMSKARQREFAKKFVDHIKKMPKGSYIRELNLAAARVRSLLYRDLRAVFEYLVVIRLGSYRNGLSMRP